MFMGWCRLLHALLCVTPWEPLLVRTIHKGLQRTLTEGVRGPPVPLVLGCSPGQKWSSTAPVVYSPGQVWCFGTNVFWETSLPVTAKRREEELSCELNWCRWIKSICSKLEVKEHWKQTVNKFDFVNNQQNWQREMVAIIAQTSSSFPPRNEVWYIESIVTNCKQVHLKPLMPTCSNMLWPLCSSQLLCILIGEGTCSWYCRQVESLQETLTLMFRPVSRSGTGLWWSCAFLHFPSTTKVILNNPPQGASQKAPWEGQSPIPPFISMRI